MPTPAMPSAFFLYRDSALRRQALAAAVGDPSRYSLYGLDELAESGFEVRHSLEPDVFPNRLQRAEAAALDRAVRLAGGYSGDFASVLASLRRLNRSDVVFSTVDTVGIPTALLRRARRVHPPVVYAAIGLPERLDQLRGAPARNLFESAFRRLDTVVAYGWGEVEALRRWFGDHVPRVVFVPFGVDASAFRPQPEVTPEDDVVSVGADPRRDFDLLVEVARVLPERTFRIVASRDNAPSRASLPSNVQLEIDVPFAGVRDRLHRARVVALPVRENSYSGATTTLLQAMACAKPVVVTRTAAIAEGYHLEDGANCRLVPPADREALERAISESLHEDVGMRLGAGARDTVERHLTWERYAGTIADLLSAAAERGRVAR